MIRKALLALALIVGVAVNSPAKAVGICNNGGATNYQGYCRITGGPYTSVQGTFQSPVIVNNNASTAHGNLDVLAWVGIGANLAVQVQAGVAHQYNSGGTFTYQAWYGKGPITLLPSNTNPVSPGDIITVTITCVTNCVSNMAGMAWNISIVNSRLNGTTWTFTINGFVAVEDLSWIEAIIEQPVYGGFTGNVPNYGLIPFRNLLFNGVNPVLQSSEAWSGVGTALSAMSLPSASGDGFVSCYGDRTVPVCGNTPTFVRTIAGGAGR